MRYKMQDGFFMYFPRFGESVRVVGLHMVRWEWWHLHGALGVVGLYMRRWEWWAFTWGDGSGGPLHGALGEAKV